MLYLLVITVSITILNLVGVSQMKQQACFVLLWAVIWERITPQEMVWRPWDWQF